MLDQPAAFSVTREDPGEGREPVELARDRQGALELAAVDLKRRDRPPREALSADDDPM